MRRRLWPVLVFAALLASCEREERRFREMPAATAHEGAVRVSELQPGPQVPDIDVQGYGSNVHAISEGQQLYKWFNCVGCHANGGGGMGPALMDEKWIYGSAPENIFDSIVEGRPNGMPSFRGKVPEDQIWQIAAYVRALGGFVASDVASSRHDEMYAHEGEARLPAPPQRASSQPGLAQAK
jgi:cytochrome c oxidase cbb3-type subunit III